MLCSRRVINFLSLKTEFLERMATWHGLTSWRGTQVTACRKGGCPQKCRGPRLLPAPVPCCTPCAHPATQEADIFPTPKGGTPSS